MKSKKIRIFIYALVAWFVGLAVITYDFAVSYAASFNENISDAEWHFWQMQEDDVSKCKDLSELSSFDVSEIDKFDMPDFSSEHTYNYYENIDVGHVSDVDYVKAWRCQVASDSEIVAVLCKQGLKASKIKHYGSGNAGLNLISKSCIGIQYCRLLGSSNLSSYLSSVYESSQKYDGFYYMSLCEALDSSSRVYEIFVRTYKLKVFNNADDALSYLNTGDTSGLAWQGKSKEYDGDSIYLNDFQMIVHDSNAYSAYYLEFKYTIPEQLRDAASLQLQIEEQYDWTITGLSSLVAYPRTFSGNDYIDLLQYPTGFKLYLDDINVISQSITDIPIASTVSRRAVIGSELAFDTSGISIGGLGGETIVKVTNSKLYLTCYVIANNKFGVNYTGSVDFVSGFNDMSSFTPDSSGNYKYNGDLKNQGHYFTDVSMDAAGNVTYNYYYYGDDNSKTEISAKDSADNTLTVVPVPGQNGSIINNITMPDHIFVSVSGSTGGSSGSGSDVGNVTIEDDDLSFNSLRDSIKDGYGLIDDTDTGTKGDGLIAMLSDLFGYLPAKFVGLIMLGTSSVVGIAVLRMIFKR